MSQNSSKTMWITVAVIIIAAIIGMVFLVQAKNADKVGPSDVDITINNEDIDLASEWVYGNPEAEHIVVEYSDFECPACAGRYPGLKSIAKEFQSDVAFVYRHFPLPQHLNAKSSAQAAEAAGMQGKFYEMHDIIFDHQSDWQGLGESKAREAFIEYAKEIGVKDIDKFEEDMNSSDVAQAVDEDYASGVALGINSTPTVFFDGQIVINSHDNDAFRQLIRDAIQSGE